MNGDQGNAQDNWGSSEDMAMAEGLHSVHFRTQYPSTRHPWYHKLARSCWRSSRTGWEIKWSAKSVMNKQASGRTEVHRIICATNHHRASTFPQTIDVPVLHWFRKMCLWYGIPQEVIANNVKYGFRTTYSRTEANQISVHGSEVDYESARTNEWLVHWAKRSTSRLPTLCIPLQHRANGRVVDGYKGGFRIGGRLVSNLRFADDIESQ